MSLDRKQKLDHNVVPDNPYLSDRAKGLSLLASLLAGESQRREQGIFDSVDELAGVCGRLEQSELAERFSRLRQILSLLEMPARRRLLCNSAIVGFGGQVSAGKSSILNSLLGERAGFRLPERIEPSTSIATYVMYAPQVDVIACSKKGGEISLDPAALEAISHQFRNAHKINPAQYIEFIGISLPEFPVRGVALLDTPGYNRSDVSTQQDYKDMIRSQNALRSVDHLIWLISAREPLLTTTDQHFIEKLNLSGEITILVNKCDLVAEVYRSSDPEHSAPIQYIRNSFENAGIRFSSIIPYYANKPEWNDGKRKVIDFLNKVSSGSNKSKERRSEIDMLLGEINKRFEYEIANRYTKQIEKILKYIDRSYNPLELSSLVKLRGMMGFERSNLHKDYAKFKALSLTIRNWVDERN